MKACSFSIHALDGVNLRMWLLMRWAAGCTLLFRLVMRFLFCLWIVVCVDKTHSLFVHFSRKPCMKIARDVQACSNTHLLFLTWLSESPPSQICKILCWVKFSYYNSNFPSWVTTFNGLRWRRRIRIKDLQVIVLNQPPIRRISLHITNVPRLCDFHLLLCKTI